MWPFKRNRAAERASGGSTSTAGAPRSGPPAWATAPPLDPTLPSMDLTMGTSDFEAELASRDRTGLTHEPLGHIVSPDAPSGTVGDIVTVVGGSGSTDTAPAGAVQRAPDMVLATRLRESTPSATSPRRTRPGDRRSHAPEAGTAGPETSFTSASAVGLPSLQLSTVVETDGPGHEIVETPAGPPGEVSVDGEAALGSQHPLDGEDAPETRPSESESPLILGASALTPTNEESVRPVGGEAPPVPRRLGLGAPIKTTPIPEAGPTEAKSPPLEMPVQRMPERGVRPPAPPQPSTGARERSVGPQPLRPATEFGSAPVEQVSRSGYESAGDVPSQEPVPSEETAIPEASLNVPAATPLVHCRPPPGVLALPSAGNANEGDAETASRGASVSPSWEPRANTGDINRGGEGVAPDGEVGSSVAGGAQRSPLPFTSPVAPVLPARPLTPVALQRAALTEAVPWSVRDTVQAATGGDLGGVTVRRGEASARAARSLAAEAFTAEGEIHLPAHHGPIDTGSGRSLLAHELAHVAQQRQLGTSRPPEGTAGGQALEAQARAVAQRVERGGALPLAEVRRPDAETPAAGGHPARDELAEGAHPHGAAGEGADWSVVSFPSLGTASLAVGAPSVQRMVESAPAATPAEPPVNTAGAPAGDTNQTDPEAKLDDLARKLYDRIRLRLGADLRLERERAGLGIGM